MQYRVISADNHLIEPPHTFLGNLPQRYHDRAPRILEGPNGGEGWSFDGKPPAKTFGLDAAASKDYKLSSKEGLSFSEIRAGHYDGAAHLADMELDGVDGSVVFPEAAVQTYVLEDRDLAVACMLAYNDWLLDEFCAPDPQRLFGLPVLPVDDGREGAIAEARRVAAKGAKGVFLPGCPRTPYQDRGYDALWAALSELDLPVCFHRHRGGPAPQEVAADHFTARTVNLYFFSIRTLSNMIFSGVFDRFPDLRVVAAEVNFGWMPFWLRQMDLEWDKGRSWDEVCAENPSSYVGTNVFTTVLDDTFGFDHLDEHLSRSIMYSTDYPHAAGLWPNTATVVPKLLGGADPAWQSRVLAGNAVRVFNLAND